MTGNLTTTKKIATVVGACAVLLGGVACTKTVEGNASAAAIETTSESSSSSSSSSSESSESSSSSSTTSSSESSSSGTDDNTPAQAPDEPYTYTDGTAVKLDAAIVDDEMSGLIGDEVGRILPFHVANQSEWTLDLTYTANDTTVDCDAGGTYVFSDSASRPFGEPTMLPTGQIGDYQVYVAVKPEALGTACTITFPFEADGASGVDVATFSMVIN